VAEIRSHAPARRSLSAHERQHLRQVRAQYARELACTGNPPEWGDLYRSRIAAIDVP
jgi:hypothetical protein